MIRPVDPCEVWIRQISRCLAGDAGAVAVAGVYFKAAAPETVNGEAGWISGEVVTALSDDGSVSLRFPNAAGADGKAHRDRFAVITDPDYRIGEEWFEIRRDVADTLAVVTPSTYRINRTDITIDCVDPLALSTLTREEALHVWNASPRDVIDYYSRLEMPIASADFRGKSSAAWTAEGWTGNAVQNDQGASLSGGSTRTLGWGTAVTSSAINESWQLSFSILSRAEGDSMGVYLDSAQTCLLALNVNGGFGKIGTVSLLRPSAGNTSFTVGSKPNGSITDFRVVRRQEWLYIHVDGQIKAIVRAPTLADLKPLFIYDTWGGNFWYVRRAFFSIVQPFLAEPTAGDRHLPGAPPTGGLWARYFNEPDAKSKANGNATIWQDLCLNPTLEPVIERLEAPNFVAANPPVFQAAAVGNTYFSVRWTGAIYLDLAAGDRNLRITAGTSTRVRVWIGKTGPGIAPYIAATGVTVGGGLQAHVGTKAGWYPIVIEADHRSGSGGIILEDRAGAGAYAAVPTTRLSPYGIFSDSVQRESHRAMIAQMSEAFAYQWTIEPQPLESGKFPGRLIPRIRAGRDTEKVITSDESSGMEVTGSAVDSCDRLMVDAAGLPTKDGGGSAHVEVVNDSTARKHLFVSTAYDQASEITDQTMLRQRADSLLTLRAGNYEQIKVEPPGQNEVVDTWPLTGALAALKWEPGDAVRLDLPEIAQVDVAPRQLTGVTKPIVPDGIGAPSVTWRQRPRGAREMILRSLRNSLATRRTYQNALITIDGSIGANPTTGSPTTASILMLPAGSKVVGLALRIVYLSGAGTGTATIEINEASTSQVVTSESPINLTALAVPIAAADQRIAARLISVTGLLVEIQLSAMVIA